MVKSTIVEPTTQAEQIDWSKKQLWYAEINGNIVLSAGEYRPDVFSGVLVSCPTNTHRVGQYSTDWSKGRFAPFTQAITLQND